MLWNLNESEDGCVVIFNSIIWFRQFHLFFLLLLCLYCVCHSLTAYGLCPCIFPYLLLRSLVVLKSVKLQEGKGRWLSLDQELVIQNGEIVGTRFPSEHHVLLDARFELPYGERLLCLACILWKQCSRAVCLCEHMKTYSVKTSILSSCVQLANSLSSG